LKPFLILIENPLLSGAQTIFFYSTFQPLTSTAAFAAPSSLAR
jgi:hypothetical protein